jgi:tRNA-specific 2-thiouridylase
LLRDQGYRVVGVTLELWSDEGTPGERSCCSPETVRRARRVAHSLGIPHVTLDLSERFYEQVVCYFVESYRAGITPNPCAKCNARVRFAAMVGLADRLGLAHVATGHYARTVGEPSGLARGADRSKDQSYVLAEVAPQILQRVLFPLGEMRKAEVRALAGAAGLEGHEAPESQEICFVADDDHRRFLYERLGELPGDVVDSAGRRLGGHGGVYNFTVGQRKGLGLSHPAPCFVLRLDADTRQVIVGSEAELQTCTMIVGDPTWHRPAPDGGLAVQVRSGGEAVPASLGEARPATAGVSGEGSSEGDLLTLVFDPPASAVAPGQTAVVYDGERVVVAGTIVHTELCGAEERLP